MTGLTQAEKTPAMYDKLLEKVEQVTRRYHSRGDLCIDELRIIRRDFAPFGMEVPPYKIVFGQVTIWNIDPKHLTFTEGTPRLRKPIQERLYNKVKKQYEDSGLDEIEVEEDGLTVSVNVSSVIGYNTSVALYAQEMTPAEVRSHPKKGTAKKAVAKKTAKKTAKRAAKKTAVSA